MGCQTRKQIKRCHTRILHYVCKCGWFCANLTGDATGVFGAFHCTARAALNAAHAECPAIINQQSSIDQLFCKLLQVPFLEGVDDALPFGTFSFSSIGHRQHKAQVERISVSLSLSLLPTTIISTTAVCDRTRNPVTYL